MCGIVGYVGQREATPILLEGLRRLEYRGYDSAGLAVAHEGRLQVSKKAGRVAGLRELTGSSAATLFRSTGLRGGPVVCNARGWDYHKSAAMVRNVDCVDSEVRACAVHR